MPMNVPFGTLSMTFGTVIATPPLAQSAAWAGPGPNFGAGKGAGAIDGEGCRGMKEWGPWSTVTGGQS